MPSCRRPSCAQPGAESDRLEQIHGALFEHARPHPLDDVLRGPPLQDRRIDAEAVQQVAEHQTGRSAADDTDLGAGGRVAPIRVRARLYFESPEPT